MTSVIKPTLDRPLGLGPLSAIDAKPFGALDDPVDETAFVATMYDATVVGNFRPAISADGINWRVGVPLPVYARSPICGRSGGWFFGGNSSALYVAEHPLGDWTQKTLGGWSGQHTAVTYYSRGFWCCCGYSGRISVTTDPWLDTWPDISFTSGAPFTGIVDGGEFWFASISQTSVTYTLWVSTDPRGGWTLRGISGWPEPLYAGVAAGNGFYLVRGQYNLYATRTPMEYGNWFPVHPAGAEAVTSLDFIDGHFYLGLASGLYVSSNPFAYWRKVSKEELGCDPAAGIIRVIAGSRRRLICAHDTTVGNVYRISTADRPNGRWRRRKPIFVDPNGNHYPSGIWAGRA